MEAIQGAGYVITIFSHLYSPHQRINHHVTRRLPISLADLALEKQCLLLQILLIAMMQSYLSRKPIDAHRYKKHSNIASNPHQVEIKTKGHRYLCPHNEGKY